MPLFRTCIAAGVTLLVCSGASAQDVTEPIGRLDPESPLTTDVGDLWHRVRNHTAIDPEQAAVSRRYLVFAPSIGSKPSTGFSGGVSWSNAFFAGDADQTHISSVSGGGKFTQNKQVLLGAKVNVFTSGDRWFLQGDNRLSFTSQNTYALGTGSPAGSAENLKYDSFRLYETAYRNIKPGLFVGAGVNVDTHLSIRANGGAASDYDRSAFVAYSQRHGLPLDRQDAVGATAGLRYDTRDNGINAHHGWLAASSVRTFFNALGGNSSWQELNVDVRTYKELSRARGQRLAFWFIGDVVTGTAPYFDLPATGADGRSARGYSDGRYRGEHLLYGEAEYRGNLTRNGLLGFVGFANLTTIGSADSGASLLGAYAPAAGGGLRLLLNKRSRTNLCADYGRGIEGSHGFYLAVQEAF